MSPFINRNRKKRMEGVGAVILASLEKFPVSLSKVLGKEIKMSFIGPRAWLSGRSTCLPSARP